MAVYTHNEVAGSPSATWPSVLTTSLAGTNFLTFVNFNNSDGTLTRAHGSAGVVTSIDRSSDASGMVIYETITGLSISVASVISSGITLDGTIFGGDDTFNGWSGIDVLTGFGGIDVLNGNGGNDILDGGTGADTMNGGTGDDTFMVDDVGDIVNENPGEGSDTIITTLASFSLAALPDIEKLTGDNTTNTLTGNAGANVITGLGGADIIDGKGGADTMIGGAGDDAYVVDNVGDVVVELAGQGFDTVRSSVAIALPANVEVLILIGVSNVSATGDGTANTLTGNGGANKISGLAGNDTVSGLGGNDILDGGTGADVMSGGTGDDTYIVDNKGDIVSELGGSGIDTVKAAISFSLSEALHAKGTIEKLTLTGSKAINATGNSAKNALTGNGAANKMQGLSGNDAIQAGAGADLLDGGKGADLMKGGTGSDTYIVDNKGDVVNEVGGSGADTVDSSLSFSLIDALHAKGTIENLTLTGSKTINATGNSAKNALAGNSASNKMQGLAGNDVIKAGAGNDKVLGGLGADKMSGGAGADTFLLERLQESGKTAGTRDVIQDFSHAQHDKIDLSAIDANTSLANDQAFTFIGSSPFSGQKGELHFRFSGSNTFVEGDVNGDKHADFQIEFVGQKTFVASDFHL